MKRVAESDSAAPSITKKARKVPEGQVGHGLFSLNSTLTWGVDTVTTKKVTYWGLDMPRSSNQAPIS